MTADDRVLEWLEQWYLDHCDGNWEHTYGFRLDTLDNPAGHCRSTLATS